MALKATVCKVELQVSDLDRGHYQGYSLTLARHPSETDERMMVRLLAFALHADEALAFTKGLCADEEPDLWSKDLTGVVELWIEVGQPEERRLRQACGRAGRVVVYNYGGRAADIWWQQTGPGLERLENLTVVNMPASAVRELAGLAGRTMRLQCTVQDGQVWLGDERATVLVEPQVRKAGG